MTECQHVAIKKVVATNLVLVMAVHTCSGKLTPETMVVGVMVIFLLLPSAEASVAVFGTHR